ncbi:MAG: DAK2 domain-containing protein, partial [Chloroflexi bacterium]|nr:DAK2 domain-containing protein [Chloroflexota bacterium]
MELTLNHAREWVLRFGQELHENRDYLTRLDAAIGDGDHGINMDRGFQAVRQKLQATPSPDLGS